jgi:uridine monophosphate synthetase
MIQDTHIQSAIHCDVGSFSCLQAQSNQGVKNMTPEIKQLILDLYAIEAIKFGAFTLKGEIPTPIYIDLRLVVSYPLLMKKMSKALAKFIAPLHFDRLCGVPNAAIPLATALSLEGDFSMIFSRKEMKDYGTKKLIEGTFEKGQTCLLVEDVTVFGASILETAAILKTQGLEVEDAIVVIDREQGARENLKENGIQLHPLISIFDLLKVLFYEKKISEETFNQVNAFFS